jgi:hypothetical protein
LGTEGLQGQDLQVDRWEVSVLGLALVLLLIHELLLWRGPLGVVNREVMRTTSASKVVAMFGVRLLTLRWSVALWQGLMLGLVDALFKRKGH